ncbi:Hsp70 family protein [Nocardia aurantiaca]|uniref:Hsp70 family protein n=1 Tax=Nocardia aurantiaca TaxID=2675850 RepID=A0A6I3KXM5_9NOCA|nr:Hsp70 family protein [Nocardia aurantiaca]MTE14802.1 Hsp70 family protein [Nocardia aurantiaca]
MSQGLALGITVGSSNTVAVTTSGGQQRLHTRPSMLGTEPEVPDSFLSRVGDPVDIRTRDGSAVRAADLVAAAIGRALDDMGPAAASVACYPAWWSHHSVEMQRTALDAAGLDTVALVPEPTAAMRWLQEVHESSHDGAMVVYDLGATGLTVSVVRTGPMSGLLGEPVRTTEVAGSEFDLLTMRFVLAHAVGGKDFDPFDPLVEQELAALRVRCKIAKETLSTNTATMVPVRLPALGGMDVRLVRDDIEELLRGPLLDSTDLVREALRRAGLSAADLDGFLLTGGGAGIPLVTELLSTEFGIPVAAAADPAHLSAHGAALLAADLLADTTETEAHPAIAVGGASHAGADDDTALTALRTATGLPQRMRAGFIAEPADAEPPGRGGGIEQRAESAAAKRLPLLPDLPEEEPAGGFRHWKRLAVIGAAAVAVAAVATGTLAMGTGSQPTPANPAGTQSSSTSPVALDAPAPSGAAASGTPAPVAGSPVGSTKPARQPGGAKPGSPATTAAAPPAPGTGDPNTPAAQADTPSPQQNPANTQPQQQQPVQVPQLPTFQQPTVQAPNITLPTGALNNTVDQLGNAVPPVPTQIIPHTGG